MQAQLVSAVRSAISTSSGPLLLEAGLQLATKVLNTSLLSSELSGFIHTYIHIYNLSLYFSFVFSDFDKQHC